MDSQLKSNNLVFAGPFLGEFGWELSHWAPHVRWLRQHYPKHHIIVGSYPGRHPLYYGFVNEFMPLPDWFLDAKYDVDCFEALAPEDTYGKLLKHYKDRCEKSGHFSKMVFTRTPRGFDHMLRNFNRVLFDKLQPSGKAIEVCDDLIEKYGGKPCVMIFAREVRRTMFLNISQNRPADVNLLPDLPTRNYPRSHWEDLFEMVYEKYKDKVTLVVGGTKYGNCLLNKAEKYNDVIDLTEFDIEESLDITIAFFHKALCSITSQSGPTHLSLQTGCPSFIYGHEFDRHAVNDNPFETDVAFFQTAIDRYNDPPEYLFKDIAVYIDWLMQERIKQAIKKVPPATIKSMGGLTDKLPKKFVLPKSTDEIPEESRKPWETLYVDGREIKKIGMVGVFDVEGSTNIPFAKAFKDMGIEVNEHNYRTERGISFTPILEMVWNSDLMIFCKGNGIPPDVYSDCSKLKPTCFFMMDSVDHLANRDFFDYAQNSTFSVVTTMAMKKALEAHGVTKPIYHIVQGIDPNEFYPVDSEKMFDVVFIGTKSEKRDAILHSITKWGFSAKAYGNGYGEYVTGNVFNRSCSQGRICLAINNTEPDIDSFSDRILRYMATKSFVVAEYSQGLEKYFENGEELVWFKDLDDLKNILTNFLRPEFDRTINMEIAERGYQKVINTFTWKHVAEQILTIAKGGKHDSLST